MRIARFGEGLVWTTVAMLAATAVPAKDVSLQNWTVPPYRGSASAQGGLTTMSDVTPGVGFVGVAPCRLVDTRAAGFPAGYGPPSLAQGSPRNFDLNSDPVCPGIPAGVEAYSLNVTVTNTQGPGFILIYPQDGAQPPVSTVNYVAGQTIANAAIVPSGTGGGVTVIAGVSGTNLIIDINGYFTDEYNPGVSFHAVSNSAAAPAIVGENTSTAQYASAILGLISSTSPGGASSAVRGLNSGTGPQGVGMWGSQAGSGWGVFGEAATGYGVYGRTAGSPPGTFSAAGVRGETAGTGIGVLGLTNNGYSGVSGYRVTGVGGLGAGADLGYSATIGLNVTGSTQASGVKNFVEPHPTDASRIIRYSSLEGNEVGTYFRGRGRFQNGIAVIEVPEDFRIVSDAEGLSIQVTPIGQMATVAVEAIGLDRIVVRGSRNVDFFYTVNGIRHAYKNLPVIDVNDKVFVPQSADDRLPEYLPESLRERLVSNGTYAADGTVNRETARRLGWERIWAERSRPKAQPITPE